MPIYAFLCDACNHSFDRLQKLSDPDPTLCPECGAEAVRRQVTAPAFRLAGSGWYETDFKKSTDKRRNLAGDSGSETGKSDSAPKTEKTAPASSSEKPAAKPATARTSNT